MPACLHINSYISMAWAKSHTVNQNATIGVHACCADSITVAMESSSPLCCVCVFFCFLACLQPLTVNFKRHRVLFKKKFTKVKCPCIPKTDNALMKGYCQSAALE